MKNKARQTQDEKKIKKKNIRTPFKSVYVSLNRINQRYAHSIWIISNVRTFDFISSLYRMDFGFSMRNILNQYRC